MAGTVDCYNPPKKRGIDVRRSTAVECTGVPCELSVFLAGFKNRILHPHMHWKERSMRAVHPQTKDRNRLLKCLGEMYLVLILVFLKLPLSTWYMVSSGNKPAAHLISCLSVTLNSWNSKK